ncbi:hypothetical protein AN640_03395 [Candidatus Epulonipiscium fishelsonii]|uniref:Uncharacterized protein n=1 Tax=Candidatus Epulonipiscium fishelsonii TaxID=77094 RepID=A0ACC8XJG2_9FIRM|nr:hypothetical protein AN640_03395 [Epulopiscium sp. SCG-D08WGA-EpuloA1]
MDKIIESLYNRKSVRAFTNQEVRKEVKEELLKATVQAPTAGNQMLYSIIDVTDLKLKKILAESCDNQSFIEKAPLVFIFVADYTRWHRSFSIAGANPREIGVGDLFLSITDATIAAQNMVVAAEALGLGSCYIGDILERCELHKELLHLPEKAVPVCMLVLGYPTEQQRSRSKPTRFDIKYIVGENSYPHLSDDDLINCYNSREDSTKSFNEYMNVFCTRKFNSNFSVEMNRSVKEYLKAYNAEITSLCNKEYLKAYNAEITSPCNKVFVYGTLMKSYSNNKHYLEDAIYLGKRVLDDYELYDLGVYPGIVDKKGEKVKGELYHIEDYMLDELDALEGEGILYIRRIVDVRDEHNLYKEKAYVYVYNNDVTECTKVPFSNQPWKKVSKQQPCFKEEYVWYASYGSNILYERFLYYIRGGRFNQREHIGCKNTRLPLKDEPILIPYSLYFGNNSSMWEGKGVAFLDTDQVGITMGRMYLITKDQFEDIWKQEGNHENWYNTIVHIGEKDGIEIVTFTNKQRRPSSSPGEAYLSIIKKGIAEIYPNLNM